MNPEIIEKAIKWINEQANFKEEMMVLEEGMEEHANCYSLFWCLKSEADLTWDKRTSRVGAGRLLISKDGKLADFEGSAPGVDWIHHFENKLFDLEDYWYLAVPYTKNKLSTLKALLELSTPDLLRRVNEEGQIIFTQSKAWNKHYTILEDLAFDLNAAGIHCEFEIRTRKIDASNNTD